MKRPSTRGRITRKIKVIELEVTIYNRATKETETYDVTCYNKINYNLDVEDYVVLESEIKSETEKLYAIPFDVFMEHAEVVAEETNED